MFQGGFPQLTAIPETDVGLFMSSYVATYLERDVRDLVRASHELEFSTFLSCLAAHLCGIASSEELARSEQFGHLFENWVIMDVLKSWWHAARDCRGRGYDGLVDR